MSSILERLDARLLPELVDILRGYLENPPHPMGMRECVFIRPNRLTGGRRYGGGAISTILSILYLERNERAYMKCQKYPAGLETCYPISPVIEDKFILMEDVREFGRTGALRHAEPPKPNPIGFMRRALDSYPSIHPQIEAHEALMADLGRSDNLRRLRPVRNQG